MAGKRVKRVKRMPTEFTLGFGDFAGHKAQLELRSGTLAELAAHIGDVEPGPKWGEYFIRGAAEYRLDANVVDPVFLVVDGDNSLGDPNRAPCPTALSRVMTDLGFNHLIYPSWSSGMKVKGAGVRKRKWRLVLPCIGIQGKQHCKALTDALHTILQRSGIDINPAPESYVYSQPWFITKRKRNKFSNWHLLFDSGRSVDVLLDFDGVDFDDVEMVKRMQPVNSAGRVGAGAVVTIDDAQVNIKTGHMLHQSLRTLLGACYARGTELETAAIAIKAELQAHKIESVRGTDRLRNVDREMRDIWHWFEQQRPVSEHFWGTA